MTNISYKKGLKRNINLYYIFKIFTAGIFHIPIWISFQQGFLSFAQMAFFNAAFFIIIFLFELPTGAFADLVGRKQSMIMGSILNAASFIYVGLFPSFTSMILFIIVNGIGVSLVSGANQSLVFDSLQEIDEEKRYPKVMANSNLYFQIFGSFSILLGGYLFTFHSGFPYILRGILYLVGLIPIVLMTEPYIDSEKFSLKSYVKQTKLGFHEAFKTKYLIKLSTLFIIIAGIAMSAQRFFIQPYMLENGLDDIQRSWVAFAIKLFIGFLTIYIASRKKLLKSRYFLLLLPAILSISLLFSPFLSWPLLIIVLIGIALASGSKDIFLGYPVQQKLKSKYRATALSSLNMFASIVYAMVNVVGGLVVSRSSVGSYYFMLGVFVFVVTIPLALSIINFPSYNQKNI